MLLKEKVIKHYKMEVSEYCCKKMEQAFSDHIFRLEYDLKGKSGRVYLSDFKITKYNTDIKFNFCPFCGQKIEMIKGE